MFNKDNRKRGFTLSEVLVVVAITVILCAIGGVTIVRYRKNLKQMEMDQTAKEIYVAVQNRLTYAESSGELSGYRKNKTRLGTKIEEKPADMKETDWDEDNYYYVSYTPKNKTCLQDTILKDILPFGAIDDAVRRDGSYIIEYNIRTAAVYGVFYTESGKDISYKEKLLPGEAYRGDDREKRKKRMAYENTSNENFQLGYYGGSGITLPSGKIDAPEIEIINGEKLIVKITDKAFGKSAEKIQTVVTLNVQGLESKKRKTLSMPVDSRGIKSLNDKEYKNWTTKKENSDQTYYVALDDVTTKGGHFAEIFKGFKPGEDIVVKAECVGKNILTPIVQSKPKTVNSLFDSVTEKDNSITAVVTGIRHIENLNSDISGLEYSKIKVRQEKSTQKAYAEKMGIELSSVEKQEKSDDDDIDFEIFQEIVSKKSGTKETFSVYNNSEKEVSKDSFYSIKTTEISSYDGNDLGVKNLKVTGQSHAGFISKVEENTSFEIQKFHLINPVIEGENTAGGLIGSVKGNATIKNCFVEGKDSKVSAAGERPAAGGLIGSVKGNAAIKNCFVEGKESKVSAAGERPAAGGLIGECISGGTINVEDTFSTALVGIHTGENKGNHKDETFVCVGGFIGRIFEPGDSSEIKNCYAGGRTQDGGEYDPKNCNVTAEVKNGRTANAGGFIGELNKPNKKDVTITNCYTTASVSGNGKVNVGGFLGFAINSKIENCYATGLVKAEGNNKKIGSFVGEAIGLSGEKNYVLSGVNDSKVKISGNNDASSVAKEEKASVIQGEKTCEKAHPYDEDLKEGGFRLKTVTGDTHYGDWPEGSTKIIVKKEIIDKTGSGINYDTLKSQELYFTLTNVTKHTQYEMPFKDFNSEENEITYERSVPVDEFGINDIFTFNETNERGENLYCDKAFKLTGGTSKEIDKGTIVFNIPHDDQVNINVKNTYSDLAKVHFRYKDGSGNGIQNIKNDVLQVGGNITPPSDAKVKVPEGKVFNGIWVLTDENGKAVGKEPTKINGKGYRINEKGDVTEQKYWIPDKPNDIERGEYNLYFTAEVERVPEITIQYGVLKGEEFVPIIDNQTYQVKKGENFNKKINITDVLSDAYRVEKVLDKRNPVINKNSVIIGENNKNVTFEINNVQKNQTYKVVVSGESAVYGVKYVFLNSMWDKESKMYVYSDDNKNKYEHTAERTFSGVVGMLTSISKDNLIETPSGFNDPVWTNKKIVKSNDNTPETYVSVTYSRKIFRMNYSLEGGYLGGSSRVQSQSYKFQQPVTLKSAPEKNGYTFKGWELRDSEEKIIKTDKCEEISYTDDNGKIYKTYVIPAGLTFDMVNRDVTAKAIWQENTTARYTVELYVQSIKDKYDAADSDKTYLYNNSVIVQDGKVGSMLSIDDNTAEEYKKKIETDDPNLKEALVFNRKNTQSRGFVDNGRQVTVKADGTTVVKIYYDRRVYTLQFKDWLGSYTSWYEPILDSNQEGEQYGLVNGEYKRLEKKQKDVTTWKIENYISAIGDEPKEQYGIINQRYKKLERTTEPYAHWVPYYTYKENSSGMYGVVDHEYVQLKNSGGNLKYQTYTIEPGGILAVRYGYIKGEYVRLTGWVGWNLQYNYYHEGKLYTGPLYKKADDLTVYTGKRYAREGNKLPLKTEPDRWERKGDGEYYKTGSTSGDLYYKEGEVYVPIRLESGENILWKYNGENYKGPRFYKDGSADYYGNRFKYEGGRYNVTDDDQGERYGFDSRGVFSLLSPVKYNEPCWVYTDDKDQKVEYRGTRYREKNTGRGWDANCTIYSVSALYGQDISGSFPIVGINEKEYTNGERWMPQRGYHTYKQVMAVILTMPAENIIFDVDTSGSNWFTMHYYVEDLSDGYKEYKTIKAKYGYLLEKYDFYSIYGFEKFHSNPEFVDGKIYPSYSKDVKFYYTRNKHNIEFNNTNYNGGNKVPYEAKIAGYLPKKDYVNTNKGSFIPTGSNILVPPIDKDYIFEGWYSSLEFGEDDKITGDETMPNSKYQVFAKWGPPEKTVTLHYKNDPESNVWVETKVSVTKYDVADSGSDKYDEDLGKALESGETVTNENFEFKQWYYDEDFNQMYSKGDPIVNDINLYADYDQKAGEKSIKVRYTVSGEDEQPVYFKVDDNGNVMYKDDGTTAQTTTNKEDEDSYYTINGTIDSSITLTPKAIHGFRPREGNVVVTFDKETEEVEIVYEPVKTWSYTIKYKLDDKDILLQKKTRYTFYEQIVESAPKFDGFKLKEDEPEYVMLSDSESKSDESHIFKYVVDKDYVFGVTGDYDFSSDNFGVTKYDGEVHKITLEEVVDKTLPENVEVAVTYVDSEGNETGGPKEVGSYYAVITVKLNDIENDIEIWKKDDIVLEIQEK